MESSDHEHHAVPAGRGLAWFQHAMRAFERSPRGLVQVASLYVLLVFAQQMLAGVPGIPAVLVLSLSLFGPALTAGVMHAVDLAQSGRPVAASDLFEGLRRPGVRTQLLVLGLFATVNAAIAVMAFRRVLGPEGLKVLELLAKHAIKPDSAQAQALALPLLKAAMAASAVFLFVWAGLFFSVPRVMFDGRNALLSIYDSIVAVLANALPMIAYVLLWCGAGFVFLIASSLVLALLSLLGPLGEMLYLLLLFATMVALVVVAATGNFLAFREVFLRSGEAPPPQAGIIV